MSKRREGILREAKVIVRYQSPDSHFFAQAPAEAGRAGNVVRCVANLVQKGRVKSIFFNSSHELYKKGMGYTYEVQFNYAGRSLKRRFTVYKLSGIHAKSDCYQVTDPYGEYIVVKIPPQPITEMDAYLEAVVHERILAQKLSKLGIKVVVPCVSSVMRHLYPLESAESMPASQLEDAYMQLLRTPEGKGYAEYLKIGGTFVFFLEFLDEPFLGDFVREFHHKELLANIKKDLVARDFDLICNRDRHAFLKEYKSIGSKHVINEIFDGLIGIYDDFGSKVDSLAAEYSLQLAPSKKKELFIDHIIKDLADESSVLNIVGIDESDTRLSFDRLNRLINSTTLNSPAFLRYLERVDQEVNWLAFKYSARKIKKIGDNLLALLAKLAELGLVLRDLKVDNLFVTDVENMELGVIDLETGGDIGSGDIERIIPAGMPGNMTVSNLLFVRQLHSIYGAGSVENILHIQDWYATIAMIFEVIVGRRLFDEARDYIIRLFKEIDDVVAKNYSDYLRSDPNAELSPDAVEKFFMLPDEEIKGHTWHFFALAKRDLKKKSSAHSYCLKEIKFVVPDALKRKVLDAIEMNLTRIRNEFCNFTLTDISGDSLNVSNATISVLKGNLILKEQLHATFKANPSVVEEKIVELAAEIDSYKRCLAFKQKERILNKKKSILNQKEVSAFALFPILLDFIIENMCREEWHSHRPRFTSGRQGMKNRQAFGAAPGWKSTVATKEDLINWLETSRQAEVDTIGLYCPSLMLPFVANMGDHEKTLKDTLLLSCFKTRTAEHKCPQGTGSSSAV